MAIELSNVTFTNQADVVSPFGVEEISNTGIANTLAGNDRIIGNGSNIASGDGIWNGNSDNRTASIDTGDGDDMITGIGDKSDDYGFGILNLGSIYTGNGNDIITGIGGIGIINTNRIDTGNGDDIIIGSGRLAIVNHSYISTGNGNDSIIAYGILTYTNPIGLGDGDDFIVVTGDINSSSTIYMGNGNDSMITYGSINRDLNGSVVELEDGNDYFRGFGDGSYSGGNGKDIMELTSGSYTVGISGAGVNFTKGSIIMNTSEFEQLIAGSTIYNISSLTNGQTISVA